MVPADGQQLVRCVIDLQGCVVQPELLAQELFQVAAHLVAVGRAADRHMRGQGETADDEPDMHIVEEATSGRLWIAVMMSSGA